MKRMKHSLKFIFTALILLMIVLSSMSIPARAESEGNTSLFLNGTNWMSGIPDDRYLYEFNIPGAHDAATCDVWDPNLVVPIPLFPVVIPFDAEFLLEPFASCQNVSIHDMLNQGVRFLDLRLTNNVTDTSVSDGELILCHGEGRLNFRCLKADGSCLTLTDVLNDVQNFLTEHPSETVILQVKEEFTVNAYKDTWQSAKDILEAYDFLYTENRWPTLGEVRGKGVLCATQADKLKMDVIQISLGNEQSTTNCSKTVDIDPVRIDYENHWDLNADDKNSQVKHFLNDRTQTLGRAGSEHMTTGAILFSNSNYITQDWEKIVVDIIKSYFFDLDILGDWQPPSWIADVVNPTIIDHITSSPNATYFGVVATDFSDETADTIWKSNYPDNDWDYYNKYLIRYIDTDGSVLHTSLVTPGDKTEVFDDESWEDVDHPGTYYLGEFTPTSDMTLMKAGNYVIEYYSSDYELIHVDEVKKSLSTTTYEDDAYEDQDNPGTYYYGEFTPTTDMRLVQVGFYEIQYFSMDTEFSAPPEVIHVDYVIKGTSSRTYLEKAWIDGKGDDPNRIYKGKFTPDHDMDMFPRTVTISYCYESETKWQNVWLYDDFTLYPVSKDGYVWMDKDKTHYYESGETIQARDNMVLYEVKKKPSTATVTFKVVNGFWDDGTNTDKNVSTNTALTAEQIPAVGNKPNDGYKAGSWDVVPSTNTINTEDTTFTYSYIKQESKNCTVHFEAGEGSGKMADQSVLTGEKYTLPACGFTAPAGYVFNGWDKGAVGDEIKIDSDTVVTAQWKIKSASSATPTSTPTVTPTKTPTITSTDSSKAAPTTGDTQDAVPWIVVIVTAAVAAGVIWLIKKKKK